jgi:hypothetical protein
MLCLIGVAAGVAGCVALATVPRPAGASPSTVVADKRRRYSVAEWSHLVADEAEAALGVLRRLAAGIAPPDVTEVQVALHEVASATSSLERAMPARTPDASTFSQQFAVVVLGARAEAARLSGVSTAGHDRRAFLAALRALREAPARVMPEARRTASDVGELTPSLRTA